jgi:hypothetical protein
MGITGFASLDKHEFLEFNGRERSQISGSGERLGLFFPHPVSFPCMKNIVFAFPRGARS